MPIKKSVGKAKKSKIRTAAKARKPVQMQKTPTKLFAKLTIKTKPSVKLKPTAKSASKATPKKSVSKPLAKPLAVKRVTMKKLMPTLKSAAGKKPVPVVKPTAVVKPTTAIKPVPAAKPAPTAKIAHKDNVIMATFVQHNIRSTPAPSDAEEYEESLLSGPRNVQPYIIKRGEQYMNKVQTDHFHEILTNWKRDLMQEVDRTVRHMKDEAVNFPDPNDRATQEEEFSLELRTRDRERKLIRKIEEAIKRIKDGTYGYCVETGEEITVKRLEARPVATLCIEAQERRERREKQYGDRDDRSR